MIDRLASAYASTLLLALGVVFAAWVLLIVDGMAVDAALIWATWAGGCAWGLMTVAAWLGAEYMASRPEPVVVAEMPVAAKVLRIQPLPPSGYQSLSAAPARDMPPIPEGKRRGAVLVALRVGRVSVRIMREAKLNEHTAGAFREWLLARVWADKERNAARLNDAGREELLALLPLLGPALRK